MNTIKLERKPTGSWGVRVRNASIEQNLVTVDSGGLFFWESTRMFLISTGRRVEIIGCDFV